MFFFPQMDQILYVLLVIYTIVDKSISGYIFYTVAYNVPTSVRVRKID